MKRKDFTKGVTNPKLRKTAKAQKKADEQRGKKVVSQVQEIHQTAREEALPDFVKNAQQKVETVKNGLSRLRNIFN